MLPLQVESVSEKGSSSSSTRADRRRSWLLGLLLVAVVVFAYQPAWHGGFIWDDDAYVTHNPLLTAPDGLSRIWFSLESPSQYFPLTYTLLRTERALWGLNPAGYHWVNILLHALNALLLWCLLRRLRLPGAWFAAALFALHPVQVESVAWIAEQKSLLSLLFCLLATWAWVEFVDAAPGRAVRFYGLSLACYALALFSKTTACTLPAAFLLILWLKKKPIGKRRLLQVVPFLLLAFGMGLLTMWWERFHQGTEGKQFAVSLIDRVLIASRALWFYTGKLVWPSNLTFSYPRWSINPSNPLAYGWLVAGAGLGLAIWRLRRVAGRGVEVAALFYVVTLGPLLGFIMLYTFRYSFVADHYQYVAVIGPLALVAAAIYRTFDVFGKGKSLAKPVFCGIILLGLGTLTWRQSRMYTDVETLWHTTLARNPGSYLAHNSLGVIYLGRGELDRAAAEFQTAVKLQPDNPEPLNNLGAIQLRQGRYRAAMAYFRKAVQVKPDYAGSYYNLGIANIQLGQADQAILEFQRALKIYPPYADAHAQIGNLLFQKGRYREAVSQFATAIKLQPLNPYVMNNLAWVLATCPARSIRNGARALELAERAVDLSGGQDPSILETLAAAYAETGRFKDAVATARQALDLAAVRKSSAQVERLRRSLRLYEAGSPYHGTLNP